MDSGPAPATERHTATIVALALVAAGVHVFANALGGYGWFRDELYYVACSKHLAAGYVDQPPLSIFVLAAVRMVAGGSLFAVRLVPALAAGLSTALLCLLVRRFGGGRAAMLLATLAFLSAPHLVAFHSFFSMNCVDIVLWLAATHALLGVIESPGTRAWLWLGLVLGAGALNKISILWLAAGIAAAVALTPLRGQLRRPGPYAAALLAALLFLPFVVWNALHGFPHLEFMRNATAHKYSSLTRARFLADLFRNMNPFTWLVALPGLRWCLFDREGRRFRALGIAFLTVVAILLANAHTKSEYAAAALPAIYACGGVALERLPRRARRVAVPATAATLALTGALLAPFAMPVLPVDAFIRYQRALGVRPATPENQRMGELGQLFADMHGWEGLARDVSAAYLTIPEPERRTTVAFVTNYGEAGALEMYAGRYPLPRVICNHNSYWFWGVGPTPITTFIRLGGARADYFESYDDVTAAGVHRCRYCMPYEDDLGIFIARRRKVPIERAWPGYRHFE